MIFILCFFCISAYVNLEFIKKIEQKEFNLFFYFFLKNSTLQIYVYLCFIVLLVGSIFEFYVLEFTFICCCCYSLLFTLLFSVALMFTLCYYSYYVLEQNGAQTTGRNGMAQQGMDGSATERHSEVRHPCRFQRESRNRVLVRRFCLALRSAPQSGWRKVSNLHRK